MKNLYQVFNIPVNASLLEIRKSYQYLCVLNPSYIFYYTKILKILSYSPYRLCYDAALLNCDIRILYQYISSLEEEEEYTLALFISWIEDFRDFVYDLRYDYKKWQDKLDEWYDEVEVILVHLKERIETFYLS